jgi:hypothetical protein
MEAAQEALTLYWELAAGQPKEFRPDLAAVQNTLALLFADAGRHEEALAAAEEAHAAYRELGEQAPGRFREEMASTQDVLAICRQRLAATAASG